MLDGKIILEFNMAEPDQRQEAHVLLKARDMQFALQDFLKKFDEIENTGLFKDKKLTKKQYEVLVTMRDEYIQFLQDREVLELV